MAGFVVAKGRVYFAISDDAGADTGGEGEVDGAATETTGDVETGEVGVVF